MNNDDLATYHSKIISLNTIDLVKFYLKNHDNCNFDMSSSASVIRGNLLDIKEKSLDLTDLISAKRNIDEINDIDDLVKQKLSEAIANKHNHITKCLEVAGGFVEKVMLRMIFENTFLGRDFESELGCQYHESPKTKEEN